MRLGRGRGSAPQVQSLVACLARRVPRHVGRCCLVCSMGWSLSPSGFCSSVFGGGKAGVLSTVLSRYYSYCLRIAAYCEVPSLDPLRVRYGGVARTRWRRLEQANIMRALIEVSSRSATSENRSVLLTRGTSAATMRSSRRRAFARLGSCFSGGQLVHLRRWFDGLVHRARTASASFGAAREHGVAYTVFGIMRSQWDAVYARSCRNMQWQVSVLPCSWASLLLCCRHAPRGRDGLICLLPRRGLHRCPRPWRLVHLRSRFSQH